MQVRERVRRVDRQRGEDRVDLGVEVVVEEGVLGGGQLLGVADADAVLARAAGRISVSQVSYCRATKSWARRAISISWASGPMPSGGVSWGSRLS